VSAPCCLPSVSRWHRRAQALSREFAAEALFEIDRRLDRAIPLSVTALTTRALPESLDSAIAAGQASFSVVRFLRGHTDRVVGLCIVAGGRYLVSVARDRRVILWDIAAGAPVQRLLTDLPDTGDESPHIACSPSTPFVAIATPTGILTLWRVAPSAVQLIARVEDPGGVARPQFSGDGAVLATSGDGGLKFRSGTRGEVTGVMELQDGVTSLALSQTGQSIAVGVPPRSDPAGQEDGGGDLLVVARSRDSGSVEAVSRCGGRQRHGECRRHTADSR
jgi:WD40 repeat protein